MLDPNMVISDIIKKMLVWMLGSIPANSEQASRGYSNSSRFKLFKKRILFSLSFFYTLLYIHFVMLHCYRAKLPQIYFPLSRSLFSSFSLLPSAPLLLSFVCFFLMMFKFKQRGQAIIKGGAFG